MGIVEFDYRLESASNSTFCIADEAISLSLKGKQITIQFTTLLSPKFAFLKKKISQTNSNCLEMFAAVL